MSCCRLETERLLLRPPGLGDIEAITAWIGDYDVAKNLSMVPHPYAESHARDWIGSVAERGAKGESYAFGVTRKSDGAYMGSCSLHLKDGKFEMGYWLGKPYWAQGYATEAARRVLGFAFHDLKAERVWAGWYHDNPKSGHVLEKLGFAPDGADRRDCMARGHSVYCNLVTLSREDFGRKKVA